MLCKYRSSKLQTLGTLVPFRRPPYPHNWYQSRLPHSAPQGIAASSWNALCLIGLWVFLACGERDSEKKISNVDVVMWIVDVVIFCKCWYLILPTNHVIWHKPVDQHEGWFKLGTDHTLASAIGGVRVQQCIVVSLSISLDSAHMQKKI